VRLKCQVEQEKEQPEAAPQPLSGLWTHVDACGRLWQVAQAFLLELADS
jgi:hypothetical protein